MDIDGCDRRLALAVGPEGLLDERDTLAHDVCDDIRGMSTPAALGVLRAAVAELGEDELYLEVGSYRGRSLVGALAGQSARAVAVENFSEFPEPADVAAAELEGALRRWAVHDRVTVLDGDAFELLPRLALPSPVGVYFYDGVHSGWAQYAALGLAEHLLADEAVVIVDDTTWPQVAAATDHYVRTHPGYHLLREFRATRQDDPVWCNGLRVYAWRRPPGAASGPGRDVRARAALQRHVDAPLRGLAWRTLAGHPAAFAAVRRVVTRGRTQVPGDP